MIFERECHHTDADYEDLNRALVNAVAIIENLRDENARLRKQLQTAKLNPAPKAK